MKQKNASAAAHKPLAPPPIIRNRKIVFPIAVIFDEGSFMKHAVASGHSRWSATRSIRAKGKSKTLSQESTTLSISIPLARQIAELLAKYDARVVHRTPEGDWL